MPKGETGPTRGIEALIAAAPHGRPGTARHIPRNVQKPEWVGKGKEEQAHGSIQDV